jgi:hypothetical protein
VQLFALITRADPEPFGAPDWTTLGLVLAIVGCFLLANGILFRNPRRMVAERLGRTPQQLRGIREFVFHRVQMTLGFMFIVAGFAAQLQGRWQPPQPRPGSPALWIGAIVVLAVALEVAAWWWSLHAVRRHVRAVLRDDPPDLETDTVLAREIGELFGVETSGDDTVQSYVARVRTSLGLTQAPRNGPRARTSDERRAFVPPFEETDHGFDEPERH